jgi:DNA-directed RNA polymerase subunit RPC12/RpoP
MTTGQNGGGATIVYVCPSCRRSHTLPARLVGRRARCRQCGHVGRIIEADSAPSQPGAYELASPHVADPDTTMTPYPPPPRAERAPRVARKGMLAKAWSGGAIEESQIQGLALLLIILSAADLLVTVKLLHASPRFFEGNPVANWFLARWNVVGLVMFKFGILGCVMVISEFIERRRPGWGRFVLFVGCVGAAYAVYTGLQLYLRHGNVS